MSADCCCPALRTFSGKLGEKRRITFIRFFTYIILLALICGLCKSVLELYLQSTVNQKQVSRCSLSTFTPFRKTSLNQTLKKISTKKWLTDQSQRIPLPYSLTQQCSDWRPMTSQNQLHTHTSDWAGEKSVLCTHYCEPSGFPRLQSERGTTLGGRQLVS